jgi:hypothetical protein
MPRLYMGLGLLVILALFTAGTYSKGRLDERIAQAERDTEVLQAAIAKRDALQAQIDTMAGENAQLIFKLKNAKPEAPKYATPIQISVCRPSLGAISVLNDKRGYAVGTPDNPRLAAGEDVKPSSLTYDAVLGEWEQCETDYQVAVTRLNGLIDSVKILQ